MPDRYWEDRELRGLIPDKCFLKVRVGFPSHGLGCIFNPHAEDVFTEPLAISRAAGESL
jgi:hypothetical protein